MLTTLIFAMPTDRSRGNCGAAIGIQDLDRWGHEHEYPEARKHRKARCKCLSNRTKLLQRGSAVTGGQSPRAGANDGPKSADREKICLTHASSLHRGHSAIDKQ